jgi:hypothetical protein
MNEENNAVSNNEAFENLLRTVRPASPSNAEETFFEAGWAAALKQHGVLEVEKQCEHPLGKRLVQNKRPAVVGWSTFSSGLAAGLAAGILASMIWLRPIDNGSNDERLPGTNITERAPHITVPQSAEQIASSEQRGSRQTSEPTPEEKSALFVWDTISWLTHLTIGVSDLPAINQEPKKLTARFVDTKQLNDALRWTSLRGDASAPTGTDSPSVILKYQPMQADSIQDFL